RLPCPITSISLRTWSAAPRPPTSSAPCVASLQGQGPGSLAAQARCTTIRPATSCLAGDGEIRRYRRLPLPQRRRANGEWKRSSWGPFAGKRRFGSPPLPRGSNTWSSPRRCTAVRLQVRSSRCPWQNFAIDLVLRPYDFDRCHSEEPFDYTQDKLRDEESRFS